MPIFSAPHELTDSDLFFDLATLVGHSLYVKCEGLNLGGSVKLRSAAGMIAAAERSGLINDDSVLIESSSGNLGVALSVIAANRGMRFTCVTDLLCNPSTATLMRSLGTELVVIQERDPKLGYLGARLDWVRQRCAADSRYVWLNQYTNEANWRAHYDETAPAILKHFPNLDVLFVGVGTGGTAMGCVRYFRDIASTARVVAIDAAGSVSFGGAAGTRLIPGLGTSVAPPLLDPNAFDDLVLVPEVDTVRACRSLATRGLVFGGSTGTVISGTLRWLEDHDPDHTLTSVCISPDMGERYLTTIYDDTWALEHFGPDALRPLPHFANRKDGTIDGTEVTQIRLPLGAGARRPHDFAGQPAHCHRPGP